MFQSKLSDYLNKIEHLVTSEDGDADTMKELANMFSLRDHHVMNPNLHDPVPLAPIRRVVSAPFDQLIFYHLKTVQAVNNQRLADAFGSQSKLMEVFLKEVLQKTKDDNWFLPICYRLCSDLRLCAGAAQRAAARDHTAADVNYHETAAGYVMECYRGCAADVRASLDVSKRLAMLNLTNQLFRLYFKINKLHLLKPLVRAIDNAPQLYVKFTMADKVTYKYYTGRRAMFDSDFRLAEDALSFAYRNCHPASRKNKRLILMYLIPVKIFLGHMPTENLLERNDLMQYSEVARSVRQGNLLKLEQALETHEAFFIKCGIYLILEKLKTIAYRNLFKRVCHIMETAQIPLEAFVEALKYMEVEDVDSAEVACLLANLILKGQIKGYISHDHQKLVISKKAPFPPLSSAAA